MCEDMFRTSLSQTNSLRTVCYEQLSELFLPMDDRIRAKIADLTQAGVRRLPEMKRHLHRFVQEQLFHNCDLPSSSDSRFWPSSRDILNCMYRNSVRLRYAHVLLCLLKYFRYALVLLSIGHTYVVHCTFAFRLCIVLQCVPYISVFVNSCGYVKCILSLPVQFTFTLSASLVIVLSSNAYNRVPANLSGSAKFCN